MTAFDQLRKGRTSNYTSSQERLARIEMDGHDVVQVKNDDVVPGRASSVEFQSAPESHAPQHHAHPARSFVEDDKHFFQTLAEQLSSPLDAQGRPIFHNQHPGVSTATVKASSAGLILHSKPSSTPRSEHPYFPNQAYSALHDQIYPSQALRTGRPKHQSSYSVVSSSASMSDHPYVELGSRTAGNSPSTTPALFTPTTTSPGSPAYSSADVGDDGSYASPYLHFMQRQAPKEYVCLVLSYLTDPLTRSAEHTLPTSMSTLSQAASSSTNTRSSTSLAAGYTARSSSVGT